MTDERAFKDAILQALEAGERGDGEETPRPPSSYFMSSIEMMAMSVFEKSTPLSRWMRHRGLNPDRGPDAVLGVGLLLSLDARRFPQPEIEHYEMPDDHDH